MKNDIGGDGDSYHSLQLHYRQFLVALICHPYHPSFHEMIFIHRDYIIRVSIWHVDQ